MSSLEDSNSEVFEPECKESNGFDVPDLVADIKQEILGAEEFECTESVLQSTKECIPGSEEQFCNDQFLPVDHVKIETIKNEETADVWDTTERQFDVESGNASVSSDNYEEGKLNNLPESSIFKCEKCSYETFYYKKLQGHISLCSKKNTNRKVHACVECDYKSHKIGNYKRHLLSHQPKEGYVHKCLECTYQTTDEFAVYKHMAEHPSSNNSESASCNQCDFQTFDNSIFGNKILQNILKTEDISEVKECYYQKCKKGDKVHVFGNECVKEVAIYKCPECKYQTKRKGNLAHHSLRHKNVNELVMFSCTTCSYQSFNKTHLQTHLLTHKSDKEVLLYKCTECEYHSKYKADLKVHALRHKNRSEVKMHKCAECSYQAIRKCDLNRHLLRHKSAREVKTHQCPKCEYGTFDKGNFNKHIYRHQISNKGVK